MNSTSENNIRLAAIGDLLLTAKAGDPKARGLDALSNDIRELFASCDVVLANLECTLPAEERVTTEPVVLSTEGQISSLKNSGISIVTLGNNHAFDCFERGFEKTISLLDSLDIKWFGAGRNILEASHPLLLEIHGIKIAFIGVVDESSGVSQFAEISGGGVAPMDVEKVCSAIRKLRPTVDHIVISPHWGYERFRIPALEQIKQGRAMIEAGASMIIGHHPHVPQGLERYQDAPIAYSLGNFLANNVYWQNGDELTWNRFERTGVILLAELNGDSILNIQQIPVFDDGENISIDRSGLGDRYLAKVNDLLSKGVTERMYNWERFRVRKVKPLLAQLTWAKLSNLRVSHFQKLWKLFSQP